ncbi:DUF4129 domain-containing protein [Actinomycetota bacterium]
MTREGARVPLVAWGATGGLLLLMVWVCAGPDVRIFVPFDGEGSSGVGAPPTYTRHEGPPDLRGRGGVGGLVWGVLMAAVLLMAAAVALWRAGVRWRMPHRSRAAGRASLDGDQTAASAAESLAAVDSSLAGLAVGGDARAGVLRAWRALEEAASREGVRLEPSRTPGDVADHLARLSGDPSAAREFERLYLLARYGASPLTGEASDRAIGLARDLRAGIGRAHDSQTGGVG